MYQGAQIGGMVSYFQYSALMAPRSRAHTQSRSSKRGSSTPLGSLADSAADHSQPAALDDIDRRILVLLSEDSRRSQRALARELGMSAPAIGERIARMERLGVIRGYGVRIGWGAAGFPMTVYLTITCVQGFEQGLVVDELSRIEELEELVIVTGANDLLARFRVRDHVHLRELLMERVWRVDGVQRTETSLVIGELEPKNVVGELLSREIAASGADVNPAPRPRGRA